MIKISEIKETVKLHYLMFYELERLIVAYLIQSSLRQPGYYTGTQQTNVPESKSKVKLISSLVTHA